MSTIKTEHQNNLVFRVDHSSEYKLYDCLDPTKDNETTNELKIRHVEFPSTVKNPGYVGFISNVLTEMECKTIIERTEETGFSPALVHIGGGIEVYDGTYRKSERCIIDDEKFACGILNRIRKFIPNYYMDDEGQPWQLQSLNERMRVLKYQYGDYFQPHRDYPYKKSDTEISFVTVMLYLNSADNEKCKGSFQGGSTMFPSKKHQSSEAYTTCPQYIPECGSVLLFDHDVNHCGAPVKEGTKYAIRTDVMYHRFLFDYGDTWR